MDNSNATHLQKYTLYLFSSLFLFFSCKSLDITSPGPSPVVPPANSQVNLATQMPAKTMDRLINSQVPQTLVQEENMQFGNGIEGDLEIRRNGKIQWASLDDERLKLTVPLQIEGEFGLQQGGLGNLFRRRVPINRELAPSFLINPEVKENWSLYLEDFELLDLGGELKLEVLGMGVDLSGTLEKQINQWAAQNLGPNHELAPLKPWVNLLWEQVGKPFSVSWEGQELGFSIQPQEVNFEEFFSEENQLALRLGLNGTIQTHPSDALPSRAFPLPNLSPNPSDENLLQALLPLSIDYSTIDQELESFLGNKTVRVDRKTLMELSNFKTGAFGELLKIEMDFKAIRNNGEEIEGALFVVGKPEFDARLQELKVSDLNFKLISDNAKAKWAVALKKGKIIRRIEAEAVFPLEELLLSTSQSFSERLSLQTPLADLKVKNLSLSPEGFYPLKDQLQIHIQANGEIEVSWK
ncbi:DUF4403 family protein [Algoriphagus kandeliae]|uniref:DUF4403 family protein n=1 Tax=Algoriphagus kandeliae TaxID=2562278 RepID=A0A4Y9QT53_9BACT|nr:DUF4403 family protein [Algoriphagus kandeliae]TFV95629.1 DUF4403 family protein [Algoriphagus kandeliae]